MTPIGAVLPSVRSRDLVAHGRELDALGFDELWLVEDCFEYGGVSGAASILASTERIGVGVGLFPVAVRNPAILAMELATIAELYPGRMTAGIGHGVEAWMRQIDARPADRLVALPAAQQQSRQVQAQRHVVGHRGHRVPQAVKERVRFHKPVPGSSLTHFHSMGSGDPVGTVLAIGS